MPHEMLDTEALHQQIEKMADDLVAMIDKPEETALLGIRTRGAILAKRLQKVIREKHNLEIDLGLLDITLYRDDLSQLDHHPQVRRTQLDFDVAGRTILLIDDVLYTGRTIRSAIDEIIDFGRPCAIKLIVLVDRGGRELPIQADYASIHYKAKDDEVVKVCFEESDGKEKVLVVTRETAIDAAKG